MTGVKIRSALRGIRAGDLGAWNELLAALRRSMVDLLRRRGIDDHLAEDLCQEALAVVWTKLDRVRTEERVMAWARSVLMNRLRSHLRTSHRAQGIPEEVPCRQASGLDPLVRHEIRTWLAGRFDQLRPDCRRVLSLRLGLACPPEETADLLGLSRAQVRRLLHQGIRLIRHSAEGEGRALARAAGVAC